MIDIFSVKTWEFSEKEKEARTKAVIQEVEALNENNTHARSSEPDEAEAVSQAPDPPRQKKSFYDVGLEVLGKQCNKTRSVLIDEMMQRYSISETRANEGFNQLVSSKIIELQTNVDRYYMADSTPF